LDSVRSFKAEVSAEVVAAGGERLRPFYAATEPPMPEGVALGVARRADGEYVVAVRTEDAAAAEKLRERARGEADVRIVKVTKRVTPAVLQGRVRPLEPGAQLNIAGAPFVGTLGAFVRDAEGRTYLLSNSHVIADEGRTPVGAVIGQPFGSAPVSALTRFVPMSAVAPNLVDCGIARLDKTEALTTFNAAVGGNVRGVAAPELGSEVTKIGRTTGIRVGRITAVEVDGLPVGYDLGTLRFNDQVEVSGGASTDFSAGGDSGSLILTRDGFAVALLFAGGRDGSGEDFTYGNRIGNVLGALGVALAA
jgi:hypothetical protein